ncbi:MAG: toll/interleukin-1 receptor domain-containing protein [Chloroflexi bacterium]|nr:toll/interleukin-1 receptor domain-containing protein [Chloroflexota bacterium]
MNPKDMKVFYVGRSPDLPPDTLDGLFDEIHRRLDQPVGRIDMPRRRKGQDFGESLARAFRFSNAVILVVGPDWQKKRWGPALKKHVEAAHRDNLPVVLLLLEGAQLPSELALEWQITRPMLKTFEFYPARGPGEFVDEVTKALEDMFTPDTVIDDFADSGLELNSADFRIPLKGLDLDEVSKKLDARVQILEPPRAMRGGRMKAEKRGKRGDWKAANGGDGGEDLAQFSAFHPREAPAGKWLKLLVYVHAEAAKYKVAEDAAEELADAPEKYALGEGAAQHGIKKGTAIRILPQMRGFRFDPVETTVKWEDDFNRAAFRMQADPKAPGFKVGVAVNGRVTFLVSGVIVGEAEISTEILAEGSVASGGQAHTSLPMYPKVFVSYSHKDKAIVEQVERATGLLGVEYLRDVNFLRSGEKWNPAILAKIDEANLFQLFWSANAKASQYVEQEWRHALAKGRPNFIRPTYWEQPMPQPPPELADLEFTSY